MLDGKKYLLVLDNVWNEDTLKWSRLKYMLIGGAKGSKNLVTTRADVVAEVSGSVHQHKLGDLSEEEAGSLFEKMAFEGNKESENSNLVDIGKEIMRKCGGVPLAIRSVMKQLRYLSARFEHENYEDDDTGADLIILEALKPHQNILRLRIENYTGSRFPSWLMVENLGFFLPNLAHLYIGIADFHKCQKIPPLWKLPSLQNLVLRNLDLVENIDGPKGDDDKFMLASNTPTDERYFSSLKQLELWGISEKILKQILCPPHHSSPLSTLNHLTLYDFDGLATMLEDVFKSLASLQSLSIRNCINLDSLSTCLTHLTSLDSLRIMDCPQLDLSIDEEAMRFEVPRNISTFELLFLDKLMSLLVWLRNLSVTVKSIQIIECPNFTTIPEWIGNFTALNRLEIAGTLMLASLSEVMRSLTALQMLRVIECSSILKQRCYEEVGEDWPNTSHTPSVDISDL